MRCFPEMNKAKRKKYLAKIFKLLNQTALIQRSSQTCEQLKHKFISISDPNKSHKGKVYRKIMSSVQIMIFNSTI